MPHPTPAHVALTYAVAAPYTNAVSITYINGLFRLTFIEQNITPGASGPEVTDVSVARCAVVMTPTTLMEFLKSGGDLYNTIAASMQQGVAAAVAEGSEKLQ